MVCRNRLELKQTEELQNLTTILPRMVLALENIEKVRKERLALREKENLQRKGRLESKQKGEKAAKTVKSSRKRPDVGEKDDFAEFMGKAQADALSEDTAIEATDDVPVETGKDDEKTKKKQVKFEVAEDDRSSVSSGSYER